MQLLYDEKGEAKISFATQKLATSLKNFPKRQAKSYKPQLYDDKVSCARKLKLKARKKKNLKLRKSLKPQRKICPCSSAKNLLSILSGSTLRRESQLCSY